MLPAGDYRRESVEALNKLDIPELGYWKADVLLKNRKQLMSHAKGMIIVCRHAMEALQDAERYYSDVIDALEKVGP